MNPIAERVVIIGQGPNQACWSEGAMRAERSIAFDGLTPGRTLGDPARIAAVNRYAESFCARLAITGAIGKKLAKLFGADLSEREELRFYSKVARRNLNARWNGKLGKGDVFNREEAKRAAEAILAEGFDRHVLLGQEVAWAFGFGKVGFLEQRLAHNNAHNKPQTFLVFPHPSGINSWWNEEFNVHRATRRLREYLNPDFDHTRA